MMVGRLLSYLEGNFSGAMLNFGKVSIFGGNKYGVSLNWGFINVPIFGCEIEKKLLRFHCRGRGRGVMFDIFGVVAFPSLINREVFGGKLLENL